MRTRYRCKENEGKKRTNNKPKCKSSYCDYSRQAPLMGRSNIFKLVYLNNSSLLFFFVLLFVYLFASWLAGLLAYTQCSVKAKCEVILSFFLSLPFFHRSMCTHNIRIVLFCLLARFFFVPADVSQGFPIASFSFSIPETQ